MTHGDGDMTKTAWTMAGTRIGFLYTDLNGTSCPETGGELFGDHRRIGDGDMANNGFEALATYDSDFDGRITSSDMGWPDLRVWIDNSHDGECSPEETASLGDIGLVAIDLDYKVLGRLDEHGNQYRFKATAWCRTRSGQVQKRTIYDVFFLTSGGD